VLVPLLPSLQTRDRPTATPHPHTVSCSSSPSFLPVSVSLTLRADPARSRVVLTPRQNTLRSQARLCFLHRLVQGLCRTYNGPECIEFCGACRRTCSLHRYIACGSMWQVALKPSETGLRAIADTFLVPTAHREELIARRESNEQRVTSNEQRARSGDRPDR
jgi:hypothetical protein